MDSKNITITEDAYDRVVALKREDERFSDSADRLVDETMADWRERFETLAAEATAELERVVGGSRTATSRGLADRQDRAFEAFDGGGTASSGGSSTARHAFLIHHRGGRESVQSSLESHPRASSTSPRRSTPTRVRSAGSRWVSSTLSSHGLGSSGLTSSRSRRRARGRLQSSTHGRSRRTTHTATGPTHSRGARDSPASRSKST
jgi:predicted CopG family antitoxin